MWDLPSSPLAELQFHVMKASEIVPTSLWMTVNIFGFEAHGPEKWQGFELSADEIYLPTDFPRLFSVEFDPGLMITNLYLYHEVFFLLFTCRQDKKCCCRNKVHKTAENAFSDRLCKHKITLNERLYCNELIELTSQGWHLHAAGYDGFSIFFIINSWISKWVHFYSRLAQKPVLEFLSPMNQQINLQRVHDLSGWLVPSIGSHHHLLLQGRNGRTKNGDSSVQLTALQISLWVRGPRDGIQKLVSRAKKKLERRKTRLKREEKISLFLSYEASSIFLPSASASRSILVLVLLLTWSSESLMIQERAITVATVWWPLDLGCHLEWQLQHH